MQKLKNSVVAILILMAFSCVKQFDFTDADASYIFLLSDIKNLDLTGFDYKKNDSGKPYFFSKEETKLNGILYFYGEWGLKKGQRISLTTSFEIQSSADRARKLFNAQINLPVDDNSKSILNKDVYGIDEGVLIYNGESVIIAAIKDRLVYRIQIDGLSVKEDDFRDNFIVKLRKISHDFAIQ